MQTERHPITVRPADLTGPDNAAVARLVEAYLLQTEREKVVHLGQTAEDPGLPARYRAEVDDPARAYADSTVYITASDEPVGVVVVQQNETSVEIKRVWVDPAARGRRVGSALVDAALGSSARRPVRLTVWDWREEAVQLYRSRGFRVVESWEDRSRLLCMELR